MNFKRALTSMLVASMVLSTAIPAFAAETNEITDPLPNSGHSKVTLEVKDTTGGGGSTDPEVPPVDPPVDPSEIIIATVPLEIPIIMDLEGNVTVPNDAKIINHSTEKGIAVTQIDAVVSADWTISSYSDDFTAKSDNTKEIGMKLRGDELLTSNKFSLTENNWNIAKDSSLPLNINAKLPKQTATTKTQIIDIEFTLGWSGLDGTDGGSDPDTGKNEVPDTPDTPDVTYTVSIVQGENGNITDTSSIQTDSSGHIASFPEVTPDTGYKFDKWINTSDNSEITLDTVITSDIEIKPIFNIDTSTPSPANWFKTNGTNTITGLSDEYLNMADAPTVLVIPKSIGGTTITAISDEAFKSKDILKSVIIPSNITSIGKSAFEGCTGINQIVIPKEVKTVGNSAFYGITNVCFETEDLKLKNFGSKASGIASAVLTCDNVTVRDELGNTEEIPVSTVMSDTSISGKLWQDFNYDFVDVSACYTSQNRLYYWLPDGTTGDINYPMYANSVNTSFYDIAEKGSIMLSRNIPNVRLHLGRGQGFYYDSKGILNAPAEFWVDCNYSDRNTYFETKTNIKSFIVHYLDKTMLCDMDVTGYTLTSDKVSISPINGNKAYYNKLTTVTIPNYSITSDNLYYAAGTGDIYSGGRSENFVKIDSTSGITLKSNSTTKSSRKLYILFKDDEQKVVSRPTEFTLDYSTDNGFYINDIRVI